jgi:hypothetical protein
MAWTALSPVKLLPDFEPISSCVFVVVQGPMGRCQRIKKVCIHSEWERSSRDDERRWNDVQAGFWAPDRALSCGLNESGERPRKQCVTYIRHKVRSPRALCGLASDSAVLLSIPRSAGPAAIAGSPCLWPCTRPNHTDIVISKPSVRVLCARTVEKLPQNYCRCFQFPRHAPRNHQCARSLQTSLQEEFPTSIDQFLIDRRGSIWNRSYVCILHVAGPKAVIVPTS